MLDLKKLRNEQAKLVKEFARPVDALRAIGLTEEEIAPVAKSIQAILKKRIVDLVNNAEEATEAPGKYKEQELPLPDEKPKEDTTPGPSQPLQQEVASTQPDDAEDAF